MDILLNSDKVDALSALIHRSKGQEFGRKLCEKLKELVPRQQFQIAIQAAIGAKIFQRKYFCHEKRCYRHVMEVISAVKEKLPKNKRKVKSVCARLVM